MKILVIQNRMGIGDMVIFLPFIVAIAKKFDFPVNILVKENTKALQFLDNHKYIDEIFYTYGDFCTYECAARYIFDNCSGQEIWEKYILLNHYYNICRNTMNERVKLAPNRLQLQHFGGTMTLAEYLENSTRDYDPVQIPPTIPVNHNNHQYDIKVKSSDKSELKLYRKKPVSGSNNIFDKMKIQTTK